MAVDAIENVAAAEKVHLTRWRMNSPFMQALVVCAVVICGPGLNGAVLGLGAGGSHPSNIPIIDKVNIVGASVTVVAGFFGGSINNQIGPRYTLILAASGYPVYLGALWWLDKGSGIPFAYVAGVWHGISAALLYSTTGYIVSSYSSEQNRGRYVASLWGSVAVGSAGGAAIVLGITSTRGKKISHVPSAVYITIIIIQCAGVLFAGLIVAPSRIRRNDGRPIALFKSLKWTEELAELPRSVLKTRTLLLAVAFFSCQLPFAFSSSLNAFYFNARTRALANLSFWVSAACGSAIIAFFCDAKCLGYRRRRALLAATVTAIFLIGTWSAIFTFLTTHDLDRTKKAWGVDWSNGTKFAGPLVIFVFLGSSWAILQGYIQWLCSTFSNEPSKLGRFSGYIEALRALGFAVAFGIDSNSVPFLTEAAAYFSLAMVGLILCVISTSKYTRNSRYGEEENVIVPEAFERNRGWFAESEPNGERKEAAVEIEPYRRLQKS